MVALLTSVRNSPCFGGLRRTKTCHRQLFARPSVCFLVTFCTTQKVTTRPLSGKLRGFPNLESTHRSRSFAPQQLKPFIKEDSRFCKPRISTPKQQIRTNKIKSFFCLAAVSLPGRHTPCAFSPPLRGFSFRLRRSHVAAATSFSRQIAASPKGRPQGRTPSAKPPQAPSILRCRSPF